MCRLVERPGEVVDDGCRERAPARDVRAQVGSDVRAELSDERVGAAQLLAGIGARGILGGRGRRGAVLSGVPVGAGGGGEVGAQALHGFAHAPAHLVGDEAHTVGEPRLDAFEVSRAGGDLGPSGLRDRVDGLAAVDGLGDEALVFELREARVDRARARGVGAAGAVGECLHEVVAVPRGFVEKAQEIQAQVAVREDGRHVSAPAR